MKAKEKQDHNWQYYKFYFNPSKFYEAKNKFENPDHPLPLNISVNS